MFWSRVNAICPMEELSRARRHPVAVLPRASSRSAAPGMATRLESVVAVLQEAAFDEDRWSVASRRIDEAFGLLGVHRQTDLIRLVQATAAAAPAE